MAATTNKGYTIPTVGGDTDAWGTLLNGNLLVLDKNLGGTATINCAGSSDITPSASDAQNLIQSLTGLLTGNISVKYPQTGGFYTVKNGTTGSFTVTIKTTNGGSTGVVVPQGSTWFVYSNGTNVVPADWNDGTQFYGVDAGSTSVLAATVRVPVAAYFTGLRVTIKCLAANDAAATLDINTIAAKPVYVGSGGTMVTVGAGAWSAGQIVAFTYDAALNGASGGWQADASPIPALGALAFLNTVAAAQIDADAVTTAKILNLNVTTGKLADNAVTLGKIQALTEGKLLGASGSTAAAQITVGSGLTLAAGTLSASSGSGGLIRRTVYTSGNTWTKQAGVAFIIVQVQAAGGGGGGANSGVNQSAGGSGAGAGGYGNKKIAVGSLGATETVTIGAAGTGGSAGDNDGTDGAAASFGAHVTCNGGSKGLGAAGFARVAGGAGGSASSGDFNIAGQDGGDGGSVGSSGTNVVAIGGKGGESELGHGGAQAMNANVTGRAATGYGAGGGGGCRFGSGTAAGGNGSGGIVIVEEYS